MTFAFPHDIDFGRVLASKDESDILMVIVQRFSTMETVCLDLAQPGRPLTTISHRAMLEHYDLLPEQAR